MHVPEIVNKHTHVQTVFRHHFHPKKMMKKPESKLAIVKTTFAPLMQLKDLKQRLNQWPTKVMPYPTIIAVSKDEMASYQSDWKGKHSPGSNNDIHESEYKNYRPKKKQHKYKVIEDIDEDDEEDDGEDESEPTEESMKFESFHTPYNSKDYLLMDDMSKGDPMVKNYNFMPTSFIDFKESDTIRPTSAVPTKWGFASSGLSQYKSTDSLWPSGTGSTFFDPEYRTLPDIVYENSPNIHIVSTPETAVGGYQKHSIKSRTRGSNARKKSKKYSKQH